MFDKKLMRRLSAVVAGAALALFASVSMAGSKGLIKFHEGDWTGNLIQGKIAEIIVSEELGYEVEYVFLPAGPPAWEAMLAGDIDIAFEFWPTYSPERHNYITEFGGDGSVEYFGDTGLVGKSGWYVPRYMIEGDESRGIEATAPDLESWEQLNKYKALFATPETAPKGRLLACPIPAWQAGDELRVEKLELDYHPVVLGTEIAQFAELESAYSRGEPLLLFSWEPHWTHAQYDLVKLRLPEYTDECFDAEQGWVEPCDWPDELPYNFGSVTLKDRHPDVHHFIRNFKMTNEQQTAMVFEVDVKERDIDEVVREWMAANEDVWRAWLAM